MAPPSLSSPSVIKTIALPIPSFCEKHCNDWSIALEMSVPWASIYEGVKLFKNIFADI